MNMLAARSAYQRNAESTISEIGDPHEIILVTLKELHKSLVALRLDRGRASEQRKHHMTRAFTALYILQSSLDFNKGGDIANSLYQLYEYCRAQLVSAFGPGNRGDLTTCSVVIGDIIDAWSSIR